MRQFGSALAVLALLGASGCTTIARPIALDAGQNSAVAQAQDYLNSLTAFQAHFTQTGWLGGGSGILWVDRPGRLRLTYFGAGGRDMVANRGLFVAYDPSNGATSTTPVARTPLGLLLAPQITLSGAVGVTAFHEAPDQLSLTLQDTTHPLQGTLTVRLARTPLRLVGVTATDIHGRSLTLTLTDLNTHPRITPALFRFPGPLAAS
jgi:outer membrane lipoprotein-sorting protein